MSALRVFLHRLQALLRWQRRERELDDEVQFHLDMQIQENVRRGMSGEEAEYAARRSFGGVGQMQETYRDYGRFRLFDDFWRDLRFAGRMLHRTPGIAVTAILTIALGIGINASVFTLINAIALRPLALPGATRLVGVYQSFRGKINRSVWGNGSLFSYPEYAEYRERNRSFSGLIAYSDIFPGSLPWYRKRL